MVEENAAVDAEEEEIHVVAALELTLQETLPMLLPQKMRRKCTAPSSATAHTSVGGFHVMARPYTVWRV